MTYQIQLKKGKLNVEKALEAMDFDVVKFESELKMLADHLKPKERKKIYGQYVTYMRGCGFKLDVRGIGKITPKIEAEPEIKQETTPEPIIAEVAAQPETAKEEVPKTIPQTPQVLEAEKISETPKEEPKAETAKTDINASATAYFACSDANLLKKLYDSMCVLVSEITWKVSKDGISMRQMDPSRVAMIDLTIEKKDLTEFDVTTPGLVAFNAEEVKKQVFAKPFKKGASISVKIDGVVGRIAFTVTDSGTRERSFATLEANADDINVPAPKITFNAEYKVTTKQFAEDIADLEKISDHITMIGTLEKLQLKAENDVTKGETTYKRGDDNLLDIEVRQESKAVYSLSYLKDIIKPLPALGELTIIEFATDMPIKITNLTKFGELKFFIAPRIETD